MQAVFLLPLLAAFTLAPVEARRAYQTVEQVEIVESADSDVGAPENVAAAKPKAQSRQDKTNRSAAVKPQAAATSEQILSSPLDCMLQFENARQASLQSHTSHAASTPAAPLRPVAKQIKSEPVDEASKPAPQQSPGWSLKWSIDTLITALALCVCAFALAKKFFFRPA